jgi:hypothetical protein
MRIVFEVCVLNQAELTARLGDCGSDGRALAAIPRVTKQTHHARMTRREFFDDTIGAVGGTVVHHDDLAFQALRQRSGQYAAQ